MLRLPCTLPSPKVAEQYGMDGHLGVTATPESVILDLISEDNSGEWVEGAEDSLSAIAGVGSEIAGDLPQAGLAPRWLSPSALEQLLSKGRVHATLAMLGPAFVASIAYVDPGNGSGRTAGLRSPEGLFLTCADILGTLSEKR